MSTRTKKPKAAAPRKKVERAAEPSKLGRPEVKMPAGHVPEALVSSRHSSEMVGRAGRGFSMGELSGAGLPLVLARRWGVPTDVRRRSVLGSNVSAIKKWYAPAQKAETTAAAKPKPKEKPARKKPIRKKPKE